MKTIYAKSILYAIAKLQAIIEKIDDIVLKKALASFIDTSPASAQYETILEHTHQKDVLFYIKEKLDKILGSFSEVDRIYVDYKYFRKMNKECYKNYDFKSRAYFRRQQSILKKIAIELEKIGVDDEFFEMELCKISSVRSIYEVTLSQEEKVMKKGKKALDFIKKKSA